MPRSSEGERAALLYRQHHKDRLVAEARRKLGEEASRVALERLVLKLARQQEKAARGGHVAEATAARGNPAHEDEVTVVESGDYGRMSSAACKKLTALVLSIYMEQWNSEESRSDMSYSRTRSASWICRGTHTGLCMGCLRRSVAGWTSFVCVVLGCQKVFGFVASGVRRADARA